MFLRKIKEGNTTIYKNGWFEFCTGWRKINFRVSPASYFDNRAQLSFSFGWGQFYISIPFIRSKYDECDPPEYGFYFYSVDGFWPDSFVWCWSRKNYFFNMPWHQEWVRTSRLLKDGNWLHETAKGRKKGTNPDWSSYETEKLIWKEEHPYTYKLKNGTIQNRTATIKVYEREWRPDWFRWTNFFSQVDRSIDVEFDKEVGERSGSWKGGVLGCSWSMLPHETPLESLRRMESVRIFK